MANKQLLLLRHAKSDWGSGVHGDFVRPLSARGKRDAPRMGRWLAQNGGLPDCIVASPSARTTETIELLCAGFGAYLSKNLQDDMHAITERAIDKVIYDSQLYHGDAAHIHEIATEQLRSFNRVLIVAHNPGMELALLRYCPDAQPFADGKFMPTCALAVIEFAEQSGVAAGKLRVLMRPSDIADIAEAPE